MPTYTFKRPTDGAMTKRKLTFDEYDQVCSGRLKVLDDDGVELEIVFNPGAATFVLKDGPSGGWMSKSFRENKYRKARRQEMTRREKDHVFKTRLIPNLGGQEADRWEDVRDEVRSKMGTSAASTYDSFVAKEKAS